MIKTPIKNIYNHKLLFNYIFLDITELNENNAN